MQLTCSCPACGVTTRIDANAATPAIDCPHCGRSRPLAVHALQDDGPTRCLNCGNSDLWRQKDFPQHWGFVMVALGAILSSIAWAYHYPGTALGVLGLFALADMVLFWIMPDVLVCYRCRARHRVAGAGGDFGPYDHEVGERYRQERLRVTQNGTGQAASAG